MAEQHPFARNEVFPSWFPNALQEFVTADSVNFRLALSDDHTVKVSAGTGDAQVSIGINGNWRYNRADVSRAHPGGGAGIYDVFVTGKAQSIVNAPAPNTDATDYAFALSIVAHNATPGIVAGSVDEYRKVGEVDWDGSKITGKRQFVGMMNTAPAEPTAEVPSQVPQKIVGATAQTADLRQLLKADRTILGGEDANGVRYSYAAAGGTILRNYLAIGDVQPAFRIAGDGRHEWGPGGGTAVDTVQRRRSAGELITEGDYKVLGGLTSRDGTAAQIYLTSIGGAAGAYFGNDFTTALYRSGAGLRTDTGLSLSGLEALGAIGPAGEYGLSLGAAGDVKLYKAAAGRARLDGDLLLNGNVGFYGVTPAARPPARVVSNAAAALRSIDRNNFTIYNLFDLVATMIADLQASGLYA